MCNGSDSTITITTSKVFRFNAHQEPEMPDQIIELSVLNNKTVSSLKSIVDSIRNRRRTQCTSLVKLFYINLSHPPNAVELSL